KYMIRIHLDEYCARLDKCQFPLERIFHYTYRDLSLTVLFQMLQCLSDDLELYEKVFGANLLDEYEHIWRALQERGWVRVSQGELALVGDGVFYTPLIQGLLAAERLEEMRQSRFSSLARRGVESAHAWEGV